MTIMAICLYLIRVVIIGVAVGVFYIKCNLFGKMSRITIMMIGIASSPMFLSFFIYLLGLFFVGWSSWFYYVVPLIVAIVWIGCFKNYILILSVIKEAGAYLTDQVKNLGSGLFLNAIGATGIVFFYALGFSTNDTFKEYVLAIYHSLNLTGYLVAMFFVVSVFSTILYVTRKMVKDGVFIKNLFMLILFTVVGCSLYLGLSMNGRPMRDTDRSHYEIEARYFAEDRNSWEIDNYTDEKYGSTLRDDHGPFWTVNLSDTYILANILRIENPIRITNICILWAYICFHILLFSTASFIAGTKRAGTLALCLFDFYEHETSLMVYGSRDAFRFIGLLLLMLYVYNIFSELLKNKVKGHQFLFLTLFCYFSMQGHEGNVYVMLGMFIFMGAVLLYYHVQARCLILCGISILFGTLLGITKTISLCLSTGRIDSSTLLAFHDTPVIAQMAENDAERIAWNTICASYSAPVFFMIILGVIGVIGLLIISWKHKETETFIYGIIIIGMIFPLTGVFDWIGYEFSRWCIEQLRYRMYFLMLFAITGAWMLTYSWNSKRLRYILTWVVVFCFSVYLYQEDSKYKAYPRNHIVASNVLVEEYRQIGDIAAEASDGDAFVYNQVLLYYLKGNPRLIFHQYSEDLLQAKSEEEIQAAVDKLNIGTIILPASGLEYHDYSLLPFWKYINENDNFGMITQEERGGNLDYVIYYRK